MAEHGQLGAYWISEHLTKPLAQSHFCSLTGLAASTQFLSSSRSQLLLEGDISIGFVIFSFHISHQPQFWICEQAGIPILYLSSPLYPPAGIERVAVRILITFN